jgi:hypothetical protein
MADTPLRQLIALFFHFRLDVAVLRKRVTIELSQGDQIPDDDCVETVMQAHLLRRFVKLHEY